jgi:hypothetical protein
MKDSSQLEQRSHDWLQARCGFPTGSGFKHLMAKTAKGQPTAARSTYFWEKVTERISGQPVQHYVNAAMQWGIDQEPVALAAYEAKTGFSVAPMGFVRHATLATGCSPDGIVDMDGLLEIKCPSTVTHLQTINNGMDSDHMAQLQGGMWLLNLQWADFVSFDPRLPAQYQLFIQRVPRDNEYILRLEAEVIGFLSDLEITLTKIKENI